MSSIVLSYLGVHQIFQLSLAAQEIGKLEMLHCSLLDLPGKWGGQMARGKSIPSLNPLGGRELEPNKVREYPWPLLLHRLMQKLLPGRRSDHFHSNDWFDRVIAHRLKQSNAKVFVGAETCALHSMVAAKQRGMACILDCAGIPSEFLNRVSLQAANEFELHIPAESNSPAMIERKKKELDLADVILCCSDFHAEKLIECGATKNKVRVIPLWADTAFWGGAADQNFSDASTPLKIIYAGAISLKKGVPYLLEAMQTLGERADLTMVGKLSPEMVGLLNEKPGNCSYRPYVTRNELRNLFMSHDLLVMPSLGDSFGFVAMEAMTSGLPVVVSSHSGVPLPSPDWRIPALKSHSIVERVLHYHQNRSALVTDSLKAASFSAQWTPERYRNSVREVYSELL